jgi:hypothetical protein
MQVEFIHQETFSQALHYKPLVTKPIMCTNTLAATGLSSAAMPRS